MNEVWKDIAGYEGKYQVSNLGNVKSLNYRRQGIEKNLVPKKNNSGRLWVELFSAHDKKQFLVHRLVAEAFIPNPDRLPQINHIDENPQNNCVDNLEWCTSSYNIRAYQNNHPDCFSKRKSTNLRNRQLDRAIIQASKAGDVIRRWDNSRAIEKEKGWSAWSISECCRGNRKTAYGYTWRFAN